MSRAKGRSKWLTDLHERRAQHITVDSISGTDLLTMEISGQSEDVILTREVATYLHWKLALILGLPCEEASP